MNAFRVSGFGFWGNSRKSVSTNARACGGSLTLAGLVKQLLSLVNALVLALVTNRLLAVFPHSDQVRHDTSEQASPV